MQHDAMPVAMSAALRFSLAAVVVNGLVWAGEQKQSNNISMEDKALRGPATWAGMEIGGWYCLGYLCQAMGLVTADASKVRAKWLANVAFYFVSSNLGLTKSFFFKTQSAFFNALAVLVVPIFPCECGTSWMEHPIRWRSTSCGRD